MKITVTQDDIDWGIRHSPMSCPVARAVMRATGKAPYVMSSMIQVSGKCRLLPAAVVEFIDAFDDGLRVQPFEFELAIK